MRLTMPRLGFHEGSDVAGEKVQEGQDVAYDWVLVV
jgi:hypothetical protein